MIKNGSQQMVKALIMTPNVTEAFLSRMAELALFPLPLPLPLVLAPWSACWPEQWSQEQEQQEEADEEEDPETSKELETGL